MFAGCSETAQYGNMREAMAKLGECDFPKAIEAAEDALYFGKSNEKAYLTSIAVKAKSHEELKQMRQAEDAYQMLVKHSEKISNVSEAKKAVDTLNPLVERCKKKG